MVDPTVVSRGPVEEIGGIGLDLHAEFDELHGGTDEGLEPSGHGTCDGMVPHVVLARLHHVALDTKDDCIDDCHA